MNTLLDDLPTWLLAIIFIGGCTGISVGLALLLRDTIRTSMREMHNDVAGYVFAVVGVLYALLLGFIILTTWEHIGSAEADVQTEAASLTALYKTTVGLPVGLRQQAQAEVRRYTSLVVTVGWPALAHGESSPRVDASLNRLYRIYASDARSGVPNSIESESLQLLDTVSSARAQRLSGASGSLNAIFWFVVLFGGAITLAFAMLFYLENTGIQVVMIALLAALVSSMLFLLIALDHPYAGGYSISPEAFQVALEQMHP